MCLTELGFSNIFVSQDNRLLRSQVIRIITCVITILEITKGDRILTTDYLRLQ